MKRHSYQTQQATGVAPSPVSSPPAGEATVRTRRKGGAALIVVISLLGTLAFLGFLFYGFAKQELASATYFSASQTKTVPLPPDAFWDWFLEQFIVGTDATLTNSALYGNKYSLLANSLGTPNRQLTNPTTAGPLDLTWGEDGTGNLFRGDVQLFDGAGIGTVVTGLNDATDGPQQFGFDINQDGVYGPGDVLADGTTAVTWENFVLNFSPAADSPFATFPNIYSNSRTPYSGIPAYRDYEPDAGYTYPDQNSLFLSYDAEVRGWVDGDPANARTYRVIIPSFFRPQLFPRRRGTNDTQTPYASGRNPNGFANIYTDPATARQVLRPHQAHVAGFDGGGNGVRRFVTRGAANVDVDGDGNNDGVQAQSGDTNRVLFPFPFYVDLDGDYEDVNNNGVLDPGEDKDGDGALDAGPNEMGVWTNPFQGQVGGGATVNYELDVDTDGDGIRDAIWIDLDFPLMTLDDGRQFVPMFAVKIVDLDSLLNVNAHGNAHGLFVARHDQLPNGRIDGAIEVIGPDNTPIVGTGSLAESISFHQSNQGLSPSEVNLYLALTADLRDGSQVDPAAANPPNRLNDQDRIASQFEMSRNYEYDPGSVYGAGAPEHRAPPVWATSNLEGLMILNGRRVFERLRNGNVRETREQILGRHADRFKIRQLYRTLANGALADGGEVPSPRPGGYLLDDDADSSILGLSTIFPDPGNTYPDGDDDLDAPGIGTFDFRSEGGSYFADAELYDLQVPPFVHPLDYLGTGADYLDLQAAAAPQLLNRVLGDGVAIARPSSAANPMRWPSYFSNAAGPTPPPQMGLWHFQRHPGLDSVPDVTGVSPWHQALLPSANPVLQDFDPFKDFLLDEPNEVILERDLRNPEYDAVFPTSETEGLYLSAVDFTKINGISRLRQLASINLDHINEKTAARIRKRLTTDSWDRLEPAQARFQTPPPPSIAFDRQWEYTPWTGASQDFQTDPGNTAVRAFPPEFGTAGATIPAGSAADPFRPELRLLLKNERLYSGHMTGDFFRYPRHKLNINRILSGEEPTAPAAGTVDRRAFDDDGNPRFRNLTPHPNLAQLVANFGVINAVVIPPIVHANPVVSTQPATAPPFSDLGRDPTASQADRESLVVAQEWWARYDRQRLARDIYVLLYTLGGGQDGLSALDNMPNNPYPPGNPDVDGNGVNDHVQAMAQFAVNYVDALDRDNVITKFEYDVNLSDGWDISANDTPSDIDYATVDGVEAQSLTFSESLWVQSSEDVNNNNSNGDTHFDDGDLHNFLYIELRNASPFDVKTYDEGWRIVRRNFATDMVEAHVELTEHLANKIKGGRTFIISCQDNTHQGGGDTLSSDLYIDTNTDGTFEAIAPFRTPTGGLPTTEQQIVDPMADIDLSFRFISGTNPEAARFNVTLALDGTGTLVGETTDTAASETQFYLTLERRRDPTQDALVNLSADSWGDWVVVDRMRVERQEFDINTANIATEVQQLLSQERPQPLVRPLEAPSNNSLDAPAEHRHSIGHTSFDQAQRLDPDFPANVDSEDRNRGNSNAPVPTDVLVWQPHFDRDFSSIFELLAVPLCGPEELTARLTSTDGTTPATMSGEYYDATAAALLPAVAGELFEDADPLDDTILTPAPGTGLADDNRWFRVLEFLTVPNRAEQAIRERLVDIVRTPGNLNLNMIRHEEVFAGLIDDPMIDRFNSTTTPLRMTDVTQAIEPRAGTESDNWMDELRLARDGIDPVNYFAQGGVGADRAYLPLPGIPGLPGDDMDASIEYGGAGIRPQFGAMPFRPLSYLDPNRLLTVTTGTNAPDTTSVDPTAYTILRKHAGIVADDFAPEVIDRQPSLEALGLFEARPTTDIGSDAYDYHTRHRLLAKIANNSTNRSNVFAVWVTVEFFEAHQPLANATPSNPNVVQVGAKLEGSPTHRGFFIVDRTRLEEAVDEDSVTNSGDNNGRNDAFRFDWRDFVIHRRTIQ